MTIAQLVAPRAALLSKFVRAFLATFGLRRPAPCTVTTLCEKNGPQKRSDPRESAFSTHRHRRSRLSRRRAEGGCERGQASAEVFWQIFKRTASQKASQKAGRLEKDPLPSERACPLSIIPWDRRRFSADADACEVLTAQWAWARSTEKIKIPPRRARESGDKGTRVDVGGRGLSTTEST